MTGTVLTSGDDRDVLTGLAGVESAAAWLDGAGDNGFVQAMLVSLQRLPAVQHEALILVGGQGLDIAVAAAICGVAPGTIRARLSRGRAALRRMLPDAGLSRPM